MIAGLLLAAAVTTDPCTPPKTTIAEQVAAERAADCAKAKEKEAAKAAKKAEKAAHPSPPWFNGFPATVGYFGGAFAAVGAEFKPPDGEGFRFSGQVMYGKIASYSHSALDPNNECAKVFEAIAPSHSEVGGMVTFTIPPWWR